MFNRVYFASRAGRAVRIWLAASFCVLSLGTGAAGAVDDAAPLYYRAAWVFEIPSVPRLAAGGGNSSAAARRRFLDETAEIELMLQRAAAARRCDWGLEPPEHDSALYGTAGLMSRLMGLARVSVRRFEFRSLASGEPLKGDGELTASLGIARWLAGNPPLLVSISTRMGIVQITLRAAAENAGNMASKGKGHFERLIATDPRLWKCDLASAITNELEYCAARLAALSAEQGLTKQQVVDGLAELNLCPIPQPLASKPAGEIVSAAGLTLRKMGSIAPAYGSGSYPRVKEAVDAWKSGVDTPIPVAAWLEVFRSAWGKCRRTQIMHDMFLEGLSSIRADGTVDEAALRRTTARYSVKRGVHAFVLKARHAPPGPDVTLEFGRLGR
jgi:hypothetical protein